MKALLRLFGIRTEFDRLFFINESRSLSGEKNRVVLALVVILFFTLLALGFAAGSIQNLQQKMDNPFTNWVDLGVTSEEISEKAREIEKRYTDPEVRKDLKLLDVRGWVKFPLWFFTQDFDPTKYNLDTLAYSAWGRSLDADDPLLANIFESEKTRIFAEDYGEYGDLVTGCNIIITRDFATKLGYNLDEPIENVLIRYRETILILKVTAVIPELPKFCNFACSPQLYNILVGKQDHRKIPCERFANKPGSSTVYKFLTPLETNKQYKQKVKDYFNTSDAPNVRMNDIYTYGNKALQEFEVSFSYRDSIALEDVEGFVANMTDQDMPITMFSTVECDADGCYELLPRDYYYLAFNFNRLNHIRAFQQDLKASFDVDVDMSQVEAKENFALVSALTLIISSVLLAFGVLSIILFVNNLLRSHLYKVRPHLGTFKAFGLNNRFLTRLYQRIVLAFLFLATVIALAAGIVVEIVEQLLQGEDSQFNIFSYWILVALIILFVVSLVVATRTINKILGDTPGNLIYGR